MTVTAKSLILKLMIVLLLSSFIKWYFYVKIRFFLISCHINRFSGVISVCS